MSDLTRGGLVANRGSWRWLTETRQACHIQGVMAEAEQSVLLWNVEIFVGKLRYPDFPEDLKWQCTCLSAFWLLAVPGSWAST